ncbi:MAG: Do family serine endopeptidase [Flavobacteriaceae bacterium]|nr:Do family serine endopeptidase [Flavobacteriaceae bacterium]
MKNILSYALVGVLSAGTTYGLIEYASPNGFFNQKETSQLNDSMQNNAHFASFNYSSSGTIMPDFTSAAERSVNAVVSIKNFGNQNSQSRRGQNPFDFFNDPFFDQFFDRGQQRQQFDEDMPSGAGSGVLISEDGYIVTNNHVIADASKLEVTLNNQQTYTAKVIGADPNTDIALIKIDEDNLPFLTFNNSDNLKVGEWVLAIGNPFGLNSTVTAGIVSAKGRGIGILRQSGDHPIESFIQTDAAINPGNSGGALINTNGHLVGINTAIYSQTGSYAGYGFAVPASIVQKVVNDFKTYGMVQRGYIGIEGMDLSNERDVRDYNRRTGNNVKTSHGFMVTGLSEKGGAIEAGIEEGDIVKEVDGRRITSFAALSAAVGGKNPGDKVDVVVIRDGKERTYKVMLKDLQGNANTRSIDDLTVMEKMGGKFEPLTDKQKVQYGIDSGVLVTEVNRTGILKDIGINQGYIIMKVNNKEVNSGKDIEKILKNYKGNVSLNFVDRYGRIYTKGFSF